MLEAVRNFVGLYANANNILIVGSCIITALIIADFITYLCSYQTLEKIITCMRTNEGEDIIGKIESIKKSGRYDLMWEDYYDAYKKENTVTLSSYLVKDDMFVKRNIFKAISRATVVVCIALMMAASIKVTGLLKSERYDIICGGCLLAGLQSVFEVLYYIIDTAKEKKLRRCLEEFRILSLRKLPGKAVDFEAMHYISKINGINARLKDIYGAVLTQNSWLDETENNNADTDTADVRAEDENKEFFIENTGE